MRFQDMMYFEHTIGSLCVCEFYIGKPMYVGTAALTTHQQASSAPSELIHALSVCSGVVLLSCRVSAYLLAFGCVIGRTAGRLHN